MNNYKKVSFMGKKMITWVNKRFIHMYHHHK